MKFRTKVLQAGKTATGIEFPTKVVDALGAGKRPPVSVTINGHTFRSTVAVVGGKYMLGINADVRKAAGVAGGDMVDVEVELDTAPREVTVPPELSKALASNPEARRDHSINCPTAKSASTRCRSRRPGQTRLVSDIWTRHSANLAREASVDTNTSIGSTSTAMLWIGRILSALVVLFLLFDGIIKVMELEIATKTTAQLGYPVSVVSVSES